jgi:hypothetical protein
MTKKKKGSSTARTPSNSVSFVCKKGLTYETTGPSGKTYEFSKNRGTPVTDRLDIESFRTNPRLCVEGSGTDGYVSILAKKKPKVETPRIKGLKSPDQLDHLHNVGRM